MKRKIASFLFSAVCVLSIIFCLSVFTFAADISAPVVSATSTADKITLSWNKPKGADGCKIYFVNSDGSYTACGTTTKNSYTVRNLSSGTDYSFTVRPFVLDEDGKRDFGEKSKAVKSTTKLPNVKEVKLDAVKYTAATVSWKAVEGADYYRVKCSRGNEANYYLVGDTENTKIKLTNLDSKTPWKVAVYAKSKKASSQNGSFLKFYTTPEALPKPVLKKTNEKSISFSWQKSPTANYYYVYATFSANSPFKQIAKTKATSYTYKINEPNKTCYIRIVPSVETSAQKLQGKMSASLKAKTNNIKISVPTTVRKGDHPLIKASEYGSKVKWTSSNTKILRINGKDFYAASPGTVTLSASYKNSKASVKITVKPALVSVMSCVYDNTHGRYMFENRINERCYPASITKLTTALVALKYMSVNDVIVVGSELKLVEGNSSRCGIAYGEKFKLGDLLYGLLLPSGGDAAYTIAVNCARKVAKNPNMGYVQAKNYFVSLMNNYVKSIGGTGTHYVNPHGYPVSGHYSTVHDLVLIAKQVLKNPTLSKVTSTSSKYVTALTGKGRQWRTTNSLINPGSGNYYKNAHGMKTGTVNDNYTGIVSVATKNGRTIITVAIGCSSYQARYDATWKLYNGYINQPF